MEDSNSGDTGGSEMLETPLRRRLNRRRFILMAGGGTASLLLMAGCGGGGGGDEVPDPNRIVVRPETVVIPSDGTAEISALTEDFSSLRVRGAVVSTIVVGSVLVSGAGDGLLRRVTSVAGRAGDSITVSTEPASLTDVFEQGKFEFDYAIRPEDIREIVGGMDGVTLSGADSRAEAEVGLPLTLAGKFQFGEYLEAEGTVKIGPTLRIKADFGEQLFEVTVAFSIKPQIAMTARSQFESGAITYSSYKIKTIVLNRIGFLIGIVPVIIVSTLDLYSTISGKLEIGVSFQFEGEKFARAGFSYAPQTGITGIAEQRGDFSFSPKTKAYGRIVAEMEVVRPEINMRINSIVGPFVGIALPKISVEAERSIPLTPGEVRKTVFKGSLAAEAKVGAKIEIFNRTIVSSEFSVSLGPAAEFSFDLTDDGEARVNIN